MNERMNERMGERTGAAETTAAETTADEINAAIEASQQALYRKAFRRRQHCADDATFDVVPGAQPLVVMRTPGVKLREFGPDEYGG